MLRENVVGDTPLIDTTAYVDPSAIIIGRVTVGPNCYIGPSVVIRADRFSADDEKARIEIGAGCGIQDLSVLHVHAEQTLKIGDETILNHGAVIHGPAAIGNRCFIGSKTVLACVDIGDSCFVRCNSVIEEVIIPPEKFIELNTIINIGNRTEMLETLRDITDAEKAYIARCVDENREYSMRYKYSLEQ
jgi:carbonic anhydrase/acetyltransferase-like protein (isoleucine patch superfamily)